MNAMIHVAALLLASTLVSPAAWRTGSTIDGRVIDVATGRSIAWADVFLEDLDQDRRPTAHQFTQADETGRFRLNDVPDGQYVLVVSRTPWRGSEQTINVAAAAPTPPLTVGLMKGAAITGIVVDPQGQPVPGVLVQAADADAVPDTTGPETVGAPSITDSLGRFRLHNLPSGRILVAGTDRRQGLINYGLQWLPGVAFTARATPVVVTAGSEVTDVTLRFSTIPDSTVVLHTVRDDDGTPIRAGVQIYPLDTTTQNVIRPVSMNMRNTATVATIVTTLRAGRYRVVVTSGPLQAETVITVDGEPRVEQVLRLREKK